MKNGFEESVHINLCKSGSLPIESFKSKSDHLLIKPAESGIMTIQVEIITLPW